MNTLLRSMLLLAALGVTALEAPKALRALSDSVRGPWALPEAGPLEPPRVADLTHPTPAETPDPLVALAPPAETPIRPN